jgi:hypothetical protein
VPHLVHFKNFIATNRVQKFWMLVVLIDHSMHGQKYYYGEIIQYIFLILILSMEVLC